MALSVWVQCQGQQCLAPSLFFHHKRDEDIFLLNQHCVSARKRFILPDRCNYHPNFTQGRTATETNQVTWLASTESLAASFQVKTSLHKQIYLCSVYLGLYPRRQEQLNRYVWKLLLLCIRGFSNCKLMHPTAQCRAALVRGSKSERRFREGHFQSQVTPSIHRGSFLQIVHATFISTDFRGDTQAPQGVRPGN